MSKFEKLKAFLNNEGTFVYLVGLAWIVVICLWVFRAHGVI